MPRLPGGLGKQTFGIGLVVPAKPYTVTLYNPLAQLGAVGQFALGQQIPGPAALVDTTHVLRDPLYTPRYPVVWYRDWAQNLLDTTLTPAARPFGQRDWPLSFAQVPASNLRVWTQSYNLNLIGKDFLPAGEIVTDLTPRPYEHHVQLRSWAWAYNLNLIGKDRFPPGGVAYDLPPRAPQQPAQTWTWNYNLSLIGKDQLPVGETALELPRQLPVDTRSWSASLNPALVAAPVFPAGEQSFDLPPRGYDYAAQLRTWLGAIPRAPAVAVALPPGAIATDRPVLIARTLPADQQNLLTSTLVTAPVPPDTTHVVRAPLYTNPRGREYSFVALRTVFGGMPPVELVLPFNQFDWPNPQQPSYHVQLRTWLQSPKVPAVAVKPFAKYDWPLSTAPLRPAYSWTWNYNLNLIGKDRLPVGEAALDLPRQLPVDIRGWIASLNLLAVPVGEIVTGLPQQPGYQVQLRTWLQSPAPIPVANPVSQSDWPLSVARRALPFGFTASYNLNLIGKDQLPVGEAVTDLAPRASPAIFQTWIQSVSLALTVVPPALPIGKTSTALPPDPRGRDAASWAQNLLQGTLTPPPTFVVQRSPLYAARPPVTVFQTWIQSVSLALTVAPVQRPFNQSDWPLSSGPRQPAQSFTGSYNLNLIGKDQLPAGEVSTGLTPPLAPAIFQTWVQSVNLALTVTPPVFPAGKTSTALPAQPPRADIGFTGSFDLSLTGKDQLPAGESVTDLPPQPALRAIELRTWIQSVNLALTVTPPSKPFSQTDWPNARGAQQPALGFAASFNLNLIGKDQLPNGEVVTDLAPRGPLTPVQLYTWLQTVNLALIAPPAVFPVGKTSLALPTLPLVFTGPQELPPPNIIIRGPPTPPVVVPPGGGGELRYRWRWCDFTDREWFKAFCEEFYRLKRLKSPEFRRQQLADLEQALDLAIERAAGGSGEPEWTFDIRTAGGMLQDEIGSSDAFDRIASGLARLALEIDDEEAFLLLGS